MRGGAEVLFGVVGSCVLCGSGCDTMVSDVVFGCGVGVVVGVGVGGGGGGGGGGVVVVVVVGGVGGVGVGGVVVGGVVAVGVVVDVVAVVDVVDAVAVAVVHLPSYIRLDSALVPVSLVS